MLSSKFGELINSVLYYCLGP